MSTDHDGVTGEGDTPEPGSEASLPAADDSRDLADAAFRAGFDSGGPGLGRTASGEDIEATPVGARGTAGSARAAARASAARAGTTEAKGRATPVRDRPARSGNIFGRISRFLREVLAELRKVIWPTNHEMVTYTIVVIIFVVFMIALVYGLDALFARGVLAIFG